MRQVISRDQIGILKYDPDIYRQSQQCVENGGSPLKAMYHEYVPEDQKVTRMLYVGILERLLAPVYIVRPIITENGWILLYENAPAHCSFFVQ